MKKLAVRLGFAVFWIAFGAAALGLLQVLLSTGFVKSPANDSPVQVPHGSLASFTGNLSPWTQHVTYKNVYQATLDFSPSVLHLDGVNEDGTTSTLLEDIWIRNIASNWTITLYYRHSDFTVDKNTTLQICTRLDPDTPLGSTVGACDKNPYQSNLGTSKTIYLVAGRNNKTGVFSGPDPNGDHSKDERGIDGARYLLHFDVSCPSEDSKPSQVGKDLEPKCNHVHDIEVSQLRTSWWDIWTHTGQRQYHCVDGKCDIWIGEEIKSK
jgi:hypothetical protein